MILAGGSGTRFWPRSRRAQPKQVLSLDGDRTMIQNTLERVKPVVSDGEVWIITNDLLAETIAKQLPDVTEAHILREPAARNTAPACGLAAFLLERQSPDTVLGVFPSDHTIGDVARFRRVVRAGAALARRSAPIVVLGVCVFAVAFFGIESYFLGNNETFVAKVGKHENDELETLPSDAIEVFPGALGGVLSLMGEADQARWS